MPYKDPEKRRQVQRESHKRYREKNPDKVKLMRAEHHQKNLLKRRAEIRANNVRAGLAKQTRPKGSKTREELVVPLSRKWFLFTDQDGETRVYFTFKKGFNSEELLDIVKHLIPAKVKSHTSLTKDIHVLPATQELPPPKAKEKKKAPRKSR